jgi:hypothetical protein
MTGRNNTSVRTLDPPLAADMQQMENLANIVAQPCQFAANFCKTVPYLRLGHEIIDA